MVFCFPCQSCADFKSAQKQVEENKKSNQQRGRAEPYQGVQQERQKKTDAQNEYLQNFGSNLKKKTKNKYAE
jgi:ribosome-binding protein aMBF1 (putative translation factor)